MNLIRPRPLIKSTFMLTKLVTSVNQLKAAGASNEEIRSILGLLINSPILDAAVAATPTPIDNVVLAMLRAMFS